MARNIRPRSMVPLLFLPLLAWQLPKVCLGFVALSSWSGNTRDLAFQGTTSSRLWLAAAESSPTQDNDEQDSFLAELFPILHKIQGVDWEGTCQYVSGELVPSSMELSGGFRFDANVAKDDDNSTTIVLEQTSYIVFPNGKKRVIEMRGERRSSDPPGPLRLDPFKGTDGGPIHTVLTEVTEPGDTIVTHEIETATGTIVLSTSLSLVYAADSSVVELIQVSHEIANGGDDDDDDPAAAVSGHQVWRFRTQEAQALRNARLLEENQQDP